MNSSDSSDAPLVLQDVQKVFHLSGNDINALQGISLTVPKGDFVAIMGPSGSGKSTLLHVIAGLTAASSGRILVHGTDLSTLRDGRLTALRRRQIGVVFQSFNLIPTLTVADNIALPMLADGQPVDQQRLNHLADFLGISDKLNRRPGKLSGGEQQRVAIARALFPSPAIILADEPTGSLDTDTGQNLCKLLHECCLQENQTILLVTHEPAVASWAKRTLVLKDGRLTGEIPADSQQNAQSLAAAYQNIINS